MKNLYISASKMLFSIVVAAAFPAQAHAEDKVKAEIILASSNAHLTLNSFDADRFLVARRRPQPPITNPNADEWALIKRTPTDLNSILTAADVGSGVKVAVLDGYANCAHAELKGRCTSVKIAGRYRNFDNHGMHTSGTVAGRLYGIANGASIINYAVFDDRGWVATGSRLADIWRAADVAGATIASMSFGCSYIALCFSAEEINVMASADAGLLYIKAAGNDGVALGNEPIGVTSEVANAAMNRFLMVGSVDVNGTISYFSNRPGSGCLLSSGATSCESNLLWMNHFIVAPGESIFSALAGGSYGYMSGTSMATPIVAGAAALLQARWPQLKTTPETVAQILLTTATDLGATGVDEVYGYGLLNIANAFQANGVVTITSQAGAKTGLTTTGLTSFSPAMMGLAKALGGITVYDRFGRDFSLAETGRLTVLDNPVPSRPFLGRGLLALAADQDNWAETLFSTEVQPQSFVGFGSRSELPGSSYASDRALRIGMSVPVGRVKAQLHLTGASDPRADFAYDPSMRPLSYMASTRLYLGTMLSSAVLPLSDTQRLMVYHLFTAGTINPWLSNTPSDTLRDMTQRRAQLAFQSRADGLSQQGAGASLWTRLNSKTFVGFNMSAVRQSGGFYTLKTDIPELSRPSVFLNAGSIAQREVGAWRLTMAGELTYGRMSSGNYVMGFTPITWASGTIEAQRSGLIFNEQTGLKDRFALKASLAPRSLSGHFYAHYQTRTPDGLGRTAASLMVPISQLGRDADRLEAAYQLSNGGNWSVEITGGRQFGPLLWTGRHEASITLRAYY